MSSKIHKKNVGKYFYDPYLNDTADPASIDINRIKTEYAAAKKMISSKQAAL